jgi:hypothetical protein
MRGIGDVASRGLYESVAEPFKVSTLVPLDCADSFCFLYNRLKTSHAINPPRTSPKTSPPAPDPIAI